MMRNEEDERKTEMAGYSFKLDFEVRNKVIKKVKLFSVFWLPKGLK